MAEINPIRYKGYYYDSDIGMYYLQSRYYDPALRRFINADDPSLIKKLSKGSLIGCNLFSYCENNGVNNSDPSGFYVVNTITIKEFYDESWSISREIKRKLYGNSPRFAVWTVDSNNSFINAWNKVGNTDYLIINTHGSYGVIADNKNLDFSISQIDKLKYKKLKCLILLGCDNGDANHAWSNVAYAFAKRVSGIVVAANGTTIVAESGKNKYGDCQYVYNPKPTRTQLKNYNAEWVIYRKDKKGGYRRGGIKFGNEFITLSRLIDNLKRLKYL